MAFLSWSRLSASANSKLLWSTRQLRLRTHAALPQGDGRGLSDALADGETRVWPAALRYNDSSMKATKPLTINSIDVDNDEELDALMAQVLAEGDKIYEAQRQESIRLGIIDEKGRLLKHELPEDMREDAGTDFGG